MWDLCPHHKTPFPWCITCTSFLWSIYSPTSWKRACLHFLLPILARAYFSLFASAPWLMANILPDPMSLSPLPSQQYLCHRRILLLDTFFSHTMMILLPVSATSWVPPPYFSLLAPPLLTGLWPLAIFQPSSVFSLAAAI